MIEFFDIICTCNEQISCVDCGYIEACALFQRCFDTLIPCELWETISSMDNIEIYINKWKEWQK